MTFEKERAVFAEFIRSKNLKRSDQRQQIMEVFLKTERHLTAEELYNMVKKKNPSIGYATIYRTMKLLTEAGLCRELHVEDGITRYEHLYNHKHHDHLICTECGKFVEIVSYCEEKWIYTHQAQARFVRSLQRLQGLTIFYNHLRENDFYNFMNNNTRHREPVNFQGDTSRG
jgi:Fur family ferric uptake transcriptional regulator